MKIHSFTVLPTTPEKLSPLLKLANNLWYSWNREARQLFVKLDREAWRSAEKSPMLTLSKISQQKMEEVAEDEHYIKELEAVYSTFKRYMDAKTWYEEQYGKPEKETIAYFCCEYGIHESLPIYSGGLGILAGDHLKSASDLGVPLVAMGLFYRQGYFRQGLNPEGKQEEFYPENDWFHMPVDLVNGDDGKPLRLSFLLGEDVLSFQVWKVQVGRVKLFLLDSNLEVNDPKHRDITKRLYDGDRDVRIRQEILLGIGGVKALRAMGYTPKAYHINEGHSAFMLLERIRCLMEDRNLSYETAKEMIWATTVFTTHTPVPAGNERFTEELVKKYLAPNVENLGLKWEDFMDLGREEPGNEDEEFCMTVLALKFSSFANGVAKLHGEVSRDMWKGLFPEIPKDEVPIGHVTNGVHSRSWQSTAFERLFVRHSEGAYYRELGDFTLWKVVDQVPDNELWQTHMERKRGLVKYVRRRLRKQLNRRGGSAGDFAKLDEVFDPSILTIGFARRFAPYKRATLLFSDLDRIRRIVNHPERPVQFVFAGKAHPADAAGKELIKQVFEIQKRTDFSNRVIFLDDYDIEMGKHLVKGVDVWLNTPKRPMEASGTSGMKAAMNGVLNLSVLDGWWDEAYHPEIGWSIGGEESGAIGDGYGDEVDSKLLYHLIEDEVAPMYYDRDAEDVPVEWVQMMKSTMRYCGEHFNAHRMLVNYIDDYYRKAEEFNSIMRENNYAAAKELADWKRKLERAWDDIEFVELHAPTQQDIVYSGSQVPINAKLKLGEIEPKNVQVEVYYGSLNNEHHMEDLKRIRMEAEGCVDGITRFKALLPCDNGGRYGFTVRVLPGHKNLSIEFLPNMIKWYS